MTEESTGKLELIFENVLGIYNALHQLGDHIFKNYCNNQEWLLTYRHGLMGLLARILTVDRNYLYLHKYQKNAESNAKIINPNEVLLNFEYFAGIIFFGMDSSLENFIFTINTLGFAKSADDFCDINQAESLKKISLYNILGSNYKNDFNPRPGYKTYFPKIEKLFQNNKDLLLNIFNYHDVSKHRSSITCGGSSGETRMRDNPKQANSKMSNTSDTLESIACKYKTFIDELLPLTLEDCGKVFDCSFNIKPNLDYIIKKAKVK